MPHSALIAGRSCPRKARERKGRAVPFLWPDRFPERRLKASTRSRISPSGRPPGSSRRRPRGSSRPPTRTAAAALRAARGAPAPGSAAASAASSPKTKKKRERALSAGLSHCRCTGASHESAPFVSTAGTGNPPPHWVGPRDERPAGSAKGALALSRNPRTPDSAAASDRDTHCRGQVRCSLAALQIAGGHEDSIGRNPFMEHIDQDKTELPKRK